MKYILLMTILFSSLSAFAEEAKVCFTNNTSHQINVTMTLSPEGTSERSILWNQGSVCMKFDPATSKVIFQSYPDNSRVYGNNCYYIEFNKNVKIEASSFTDFSYGCNFVE